MGGWTQSCVGLPGCLPPCFLESQVGRRTLRTSSACQGVRLQRLLSFAASPVACRLSKMGTVEFSLIIDVWLQKSFYLPLNLQLQVKSLIMMNYASGIDVLLSKPRKSN